MWRESQGFTIPNVSALIYNTHMTINVDIYEMDYSVSPGGINCWEMDVRTKLGHSSNYSDFPTAGHALNQLIRYYPDQSFVINVTSLDAYNALQMSDV